MKKFILLLGAAIALVSCGPKPCLKDGQPARVVETAMVEFNEDQRNIEPPDRSIKLQLADKTVRVCIVPDYVSQHLRPGDVIRGPITSDRDWRYQ